MVSLREGLMLGEGGVVSLVGAGGKTTLMFRLARELAAAGETVLTTTTTKIYAPGPEQSSHLILSRSLPEIAQQAQKLLKKYRHVSAAANKLSDQGKLGGFTPEIVQNIWDRRLFRWILVEADGAAGRPLKAPGEHEPVIPACTSLLVAMIGLNGAGRPLNDQWVFRPERFLQLTGSNPGAQISESDILAVLVHPKGVFKNAPTDALRIVFCNQADIPRNFAAGQRLVQALIKKRNTGLDRIVIGQTSFDPPIIMIADLKAKSEYET